jgi:protein required for attachment to host cells
MNMKVVVADQSEARLYDYDRTDRSLQLLQHLTDPEARLHSRDLKSDRPGSKADRGPLRAGRRGAAAHHGVGADRDPREHEAQVFAHRIVAALQSAEQHSAADRIVLMAAPRFLGLLRQCLPESLRHLVAAEVHKDLVHEPESAVLAHLGDDALIF